MSQSVIRAARIIDSVAAHPRTVGELAEEFGLHRSTMFRELRALEEVGYVRRTSNGRYTLGLRLIALSQVAFENLDLREAAHQHIRRLHREVGNTIHLAALLDDSIVYVDKVEEQNGVRMYSRIGRAVLPYCSGVGKAILAELDTAARDAVLPDEPWERFTERTLESRQALDRELARVRNQGWAEDHGEFEALVNCIAVPIRSRSGVVGALSITALRVVEDIKRLRHRLPLLHKTAESISAELG